MMKMIILFCYLGLLAEAQYCNSRFEFCIDYPKGFKGKGESTNGDGQRFTSPDGKAEIVAWGRLAVVDLDKISQEYDMSVKEVKLAYKLKKADMFIISGTDKAGNILYRKTVKGKMEDGTAVFRTLQITYPPGRQGVYKDYCAYIAKSLK